MLNSLSVIMLSICISNLFVAQNIASEKIESLASSINQKTVPLIAPITETIDQTPLGDSDADDPAIYIHPQDPALSFVITALKKGGLRVYDLTGKEIQNIAPHNTRYNNVDLVYGVEFQSQIAGEIATVDLAIASDRKNDTVAIYAINANGNNRQDIAASPLLTEVTAIDLPPSIFGVDDGEATAYGLTAYKSVVDGKSYVFVSQSDGNKIAQLELKPQLGAADELTVKAQIVDTFELPIPPGLETAAALVEGMVVNHQTGILYLAQENFGIWQANAEPNRDRQLTIIEQVKDYQKNSPLSADIEGLTIYYDKDGHEYLIASSQGDNTFALYDLGNNNSYLGSFKLKNVEKTDGLDVTNISINKKYDAGLLVVQDGLNQNQTNFKFVSMADIINLLK
jgi:myo-inositol-hexaphosphate 3-phosphohydrolase